MPDWEITMHAVERARLSDELQRIRREIMDEIARLTPTFTGVSFEKLDGSAASSGRATTRHPEGTPTMHVDEFVRGKGKF